MIIKTTIIYATLIIFETLTSIFISLIYNLVNSGSFKHYIFSSISVPFIWNFWRLLFHYLPLLICFLLLCKFLFRLRLNFKPIIFSTFNVIFFVILNLYYVNLNLPTLYIHEFFFWIICFSVFISPIILGTIPYFRRLMESY